RSTQPTCSRAPTARGGSRQASTPTSSSSPTRTGVTSPTTSAVPSSTRSSEVAGSCGAARHNRGMPTRKQRRRREKELRHEYDLVWEDAEGNELDPDEAPANGSDKRASARPSSRSGRQGRQPQAPSWQR